MNKESILMRTIQLEASKQGARLFRNNVGLGWTGNPCRSCQQTMRRLRYGLCVGSSDLIGWTKDGRFVALEIKAGSRTTQEQAAFLQAVIKALGIGAVCHSIDDAALALHANP